MDWYVVKSPIDGHCAVVQRPGEGGTVGWAILHGPDTYTGCWTWVSSNCTGGPYYKC